LVERAVAGKRMPKWNPGPLKGGWKKAGEGQSEAERLMGYLAWRGLRQAPRRTPIRLDQRRDPAGRRSRPSSAASPRKYDAMA
jgi:hypothetical protein